MKNGCDARSTLVRCDASPALGGGHVMRCLTLARALLAAGRELRFACAEDSMMSVPALARSGFDVIELSNPLDPHELLTRIEWPIGTMVIDHYGIDAGFERALRPHTGKIVVIDDLADRPHDCDLLIDQNFGRHAADYAGLVPTEAIVLAGAQYALLRPEFPAVRERTLARRAATEVVGRILISMGLTDTSGITLDVLRSVLTANTGAVVDVILGTNAPSLPALRALAASRDDVILHVDVADMAPLMAEADLAIGAGGSTNWERCCLGLPTVVMVLAENQRNIVRALGEAGAVLPAATLDEVAAGVSRLAGSVEERRSISAAAACVTDGDGAAWVASLVTDETDTG